MRLGILALAGLVPVRAIWPFQPKRFTQEAFVDAGTLGVEGEDLGRIVAFGDWNGDQKLDLFTLNEAQTEITIYQWNKDAYKYTPNHRLSLSQKVTNVIPGDYNHDGRLDMLVMLEEKTDGGWWGTRETKTGMTVYLGPDFKEWTLDSATEAQPIVFGADGSMRASLLGYTPAIEDQPSAVKTWQNTGKGFTLQPSRLLPSDQVCQLATPHSSAYIDIDGDCLPDLVLHCAKPRASQRYIQIWLNKGSAGYVLSNTYDLPRGSGPLSFADIDRDGTMDIIFPICARTSTSAGTGSECSVNIAYNRQIPICSGIASDTSNGTKCRGWGELCVSDPNYTFSFEDLATIPFSSLFAHEPDLLIHPPKTPDILLPFRPGDFNVDGFPDLLLTISNDTAHSGLFRGAGTQVRVLENVPCRKGVPGCDGKQKRGFKVKSGKGWEVLDAMTDVLGASWIDIDDDGSLDVVVQRSGEQGQGKIAFIQNNFYHDAFFLKAQVLNGACDGDCRPVGGHKYKPLGVSYSGATYKFTVLDTLGRRVAQQSAQLPQTGYHALNTPYSFIGLGRTNNYVERLTIGASLDPPNHITDIESIVPNSQILINPPFTDDSAKRTEWRTELFLHPGDWIPWVGAAVVGTVLVLVFVVVGLYEREKKEDEKDRQRALHAINFQAL